jgi:dihydrofolate reductase
MRKVVLYQILSLDGVAEEPGDWFADGGPEMFANLGRVIEAQDEILLGRGTYDYWVGYWPTSDVEPFATFINTSPKHVFTSKPPEQQWDNTTVVTGSAADHVRGLKAGDGGDIGIHGSTSLARSLMRDRLVDELELVVAASLAGRGRRLFDDGDDLQRLELVRNERTPEGTLFLTYRCGR